MPPIYDKQFYNNKYDKLIEVSDPKEVNRRAMRIYNRDVYLSKRKNKKYMIQDNNNKYIHFGDINMEDATFHKDPIRIKKFKQRNKRWATVDNKFSPAYLSYWLLW
jgi:hypothetical protein